MNYDVFLVGVGGQGILTIGEILAGVAQTNDIPVNFFPSKGMAQRGGFVKAQLRIGWPEAGPNIPEHRADLVIAMERSESLKAVRYVKKGGEFVLFGDRWEPTAVMLGKAPYPTLERVKTEVLTAGARLYFIDPACLPLYQGEKVSENVFILGAAAKNTRLGNLFAPKDILTQIQNRWKRSSEANEFAFNAGFTYAIVGETAPEAAL